MREPWDAEVSRRDFAEWHAAMSAGAYSTAWAINDLRAQHWPSAHQLWSGEPLAGRSLELQALHGFGDFVQMMRFIPTLNRLGCDVSLNVRPELKALLPYFEGRFRMLEEREPHPQRLTLEAMELPYALRIRELDLPRAGHYLRLPAGVTAQVRRQMNPMSLLPKIGIVYSGSAWDPERWIPAEQVEPLLEVTGCEWWNMQGPDATQEGHGLPMHHLARAARGGLLEFAAAIKNLDLLVTVDTLAAHVAGAVGTPVWLLLKKEADWRWMRDRADSPWYPGMRLLRQRSPGNWAGVIKQVRTELSASLHPRARVSANAARSMHTGLLQWKSTSSPVYATLSR